MELPPLPKRDENGIRPAAETAQVVLARRIIRAREGRGLSRRELAARCGLAIETLARIESGRHMPRPATIEKLAHVLREF